MSNGSLGIGIVGAGDIVRTRHMPKLAEVENITFAAVTNRRRETAEAFAADHSVPNVLDDWRAVVEHPDVDVVWIGATPYMHARVSVAALDAGKHVFCQARMARNLAEAREMLDAAERNPGLVAAVCPPGTGVAGDRTMLRLLKVDRFAGALRQVRMSSFGDTAVTNDILHWRHDFDVSGNNVMNVGIMVEALQRWVGPERDVQAMTHVHIKERRNAETDAFEAVRVPDSFTAMGELVSGADYVYQWSGLAHHEPATELWLYGDEGTLVYDFDHDTIAGAKAGEDELAPIEIPADEHYDPNVEVDFIDAVRSGSHDTGLAPSFARAYKYMEFMEAATRSARDGRRVSFPLE